MRKEQADGGWDMRIDSAENSDACRRTRAYQLTTDTITLLPLPGLLHTAMEKQETVMKYESERQANGLN
jgi:hypothetical protein